MQVQSRFVLVLVCLFEECLASGLCVPELPSYIKSNIHVLIFLYFVFLYFFPPHLFFFINIVLLLPLPARIT